MSEINNYEERISALEALAAQLKAENSELNQMVIAMNERIAVLEAIILPEKNEENIGAEATDTVITDSTDGTDNTTADTTENTANTDPEGNTDTGDNTDSEGSIAAVENTDSEGSTAAVENTDSQDSTETAEKADAGSQSLEDKYASDDDSSFYPSTLDPELLKFFESISNETKAASEAPAASDTPEVSDVPSASDEHTDSEHADTENTAPPVQPAPAVVPAPKKTVLRRPGFHLYNWFYFSNPKDHGYLYRMREDETEQERLTDYPISIGTFKFKDGRLYFKDANWSEKSIKLSSEALNAYDLEDAIDLQALKISGFKYNGWIYYANTSMGNFLYRIKEDGSCNERLSNYSLPKTQNFRASGSHLDYYDDFLVPHQITLK